MPHTERADDPAGRARPRVRLLDGFRLLAALMVVCWHYSGLTHGNGQPSADIRSLHPFAAYGWLGVELFFLISGFVIAMSAVNRSVGEFAVSRFVRLFPAYWLGVLVTAVVLLIWPIAVHPPKLSDVGVNLTMLQEGFRVPSVDAVYWTLFAELRFYLLFAFVVWRGVTYRERSGSASIWLAASALTYSSHGLIHTLVMPDWAPFFVAGLALLPDAPVRVESAPVDDRGRHLPARPAPGSGFEQLPPDRAADAGLAGGRHPGGLLPARRRGRAGLAAGQLAVADRGRRR